MAIGPSILRIGVVDPVGSIDPRNMAEATTILRRAAGLDELRAENAMRSAYSFGAGVVDEFYVSDTGDRKRADRAAKQKAEELLEKLKKENRGS